MRKAGPMLLDGYDLMRRIDRRLKMLEKIEAETRVRNLREEVTTRDFYTLQGRIKELAGFAAHFVRASRANFKYEERKKK